MLKKIRNLGLLCAALIMTWTLTASAEEEVTITPQGEIKTVDLDALPKSNTVNSKGQPYITPRSQPMDKRETADPQKTPYPKSVEDNAKRLPDPTDTSGVVDIVSMQNNIVDPTSIGQSKPDVFKLSETGKTEQKNVISLNRDFLGGSMSEQLYNQVQARFGQMQSSGARARSVESREQLSSELLPHDGDLQNQPAQVIEH